MSMMLLLSRKVEVSVIQITVKSKMLYESEKYRLPKANSLSMASMQKMTNNTMLILKKRSVVAYDCVGVCAIKIAMLNRMSAMINASKNELSTILKTIF